MAINNTPLLEICVDSVESIKNAIAGGADRLELCSALSEGGLTPSLGLATLAKRISQRLPVFAMLRIRGGDFVYKSDEIDAMLIDMAELKSVGIDGFVFGALTRTGEVDIITCRKILEAAGQLPVTFHRAFDEVAEPFEAIEIICEFGFARILTSGCSRCAMDNTELIARLVKKANGRIIVMPGAGLNSDNVAVVRKLTGALEFHGSASKYKNDDRPGFAHNNIKVTDPDIVRLMIENLRSQGD